MIKGIENNVKWKKKSAGFKNLHILLLRTRRKEFIEKKILEVTIRRYV